MLLSIMILPLIGYSIYYLVQEGEYPHIYIRDFRFWLLLISFLLVVGLAAYNILPIP